MFSPYYALSGRTDPSNHVALNIALYGPGANRWAMTERRRGVLHRAQSSLAIGPSSLSWDGEGLTIDFDEITAPIPRRIKGRVRLLPDATFPHGIALDDAGRHVWQPIAPRARVEVTLDRPGLSWGGEGYFDTNAGSEPIEDAFLEWQWSRAHLTRDTAIVYEGARRDGSTFAMAMRFDRQGGVEAVEPPPAIALPRTGWNMPRVARADDGHPVKLRTTWEDTPFYARSAFVTRMFGEDAEAVHESLSLTRLTHPLVRAMLPFRMPRTLR